MTEKKDQNVAATSESPKGAKTADSKSNFANSTQGEKAKSGATVAQSSGYGWWLLFIVVLIALASLAWFNWPQFRERVGAHLDFLPTTQPTSEIPLESAPQAETPTSNEAATQTPTPDIAPENPAPAPTQAQAPDYSSDFHQLEQANATLRDQMEHQNRAIAGLRQQLAVMQRSVTAQASRLGQLGNVSRDDWLLAEADYLLRLANQRLLLEDDSRAALGLVERVDEILREVDLPDLYGVRQQLAREITALKLVQNIDRQGLYLRLRALEEQLIRANIQPQFNMESVKQPREMQPTSDDGAPLWEREWHNFTRFMRDSVRPIDGDINPVMLSPQSEARFRQTLRLYMEQAQLALLRGDTTVYKDALDSARDLLLTYSTASPQRKALAQQLTELSEQRIQVEIPDLSASQLALRNYIERLHKTSGQETSAPQQEDSQ
ncbi:uroporphyrinogen-III C-methyltransferase [Microbulbifer sp. OS29]|uniref:Uroporphyrinogen-III C-methyltransferase n=1 Tax=Microbulbifer okhotskensis TaxID=2926617 RepID=A0A9X2EIQ1_9GAMM|nr:uroporphyrinogen-III C-methyltransferase [Microbulbifer okhotskensis]MCO1332989.1 uroporphyrinogen-III C-methyltransferase [Microbulbifer okhotskensis]